jgi:DNA replication protein DnaC
VLREVIARTGARGLYYDTRALLRDIRSTYNPTLQTAEMDVIRPVMEAELLVLDDLGAERLTDWVEETIGLIVNTRYNERRPTIFTSNYEDIPDDGEMNSLLVRVGFRLHSRLREMCDFLEYDGPDYRNLPPNAGADDLYKLWKAQPRRKLPARTSGQIRAQLKAPKHEKVDLKWSGGRAGS